MGKKITLRRKRRNRHNTRKKRNTQNTRKITIQHNKYSRKSRSSPQIRIHKGGVTPEHSPRRSPSPGSQHSHHSESNSVSDLEARLALLQQDTPKTPVVLSPYHIPPYVLKFADLPLPELSPDFESIDYEHRKANGLPLSYTSSPTIEPEDLPPTSLQVLGYNTHPFIKRKMLPNMKGAELPKLGRRQNLIIDVHGGIGNILTDNEKRLANHYLRVIEIGDYGGIVSINSPEYYKILNNILRSPKYRELFDDTHKGKELRERAYTKLCKYISDSRKPNCIKPSINKLDKYFKLIHLTHDRKFSGDREDKDVRETHIITAETLTSLEHQGLFVPLPYNKDKTGLPYFKKKLFQLYPETSLLSKNTSISLIYNILPLAIKNNTQFNIFVTSCNYNEQNFMINPLIQDNSTGITQFLSKGKEFLFLISSLSAKVVSCLGKNLSYTVFQGKETSYQFAEYVDENTITDELIDAMAKPLIHLRHSIFDDGYTRDISDNYNYETILPYFLGPIVPDGAMIHSSTTNELVVELDKSEPFKTLPNPKQAELYAMAKLFLIQDFVYNIGTILEIAVSMLTVAEKVYSMFLRDMDSKPDDDSLFPIGIQELFKKNRDNFLRLLHFLDKVYSDIYSYYLPRLQNDKNNKQPEFKSKRFINKPFYVKFMKLYKSGSLFFDEHNNFMHESSSYENMNPYKYKQRINMDEIRDRMPNKGKFLSSKKSPRLSNEAKDKIFVSL
jgi:hypothetical protein